MSQDSHAERPLERRRTDLGAAWGHFGGALLIGAAYFVLAKLGLQLASVHPSATPIWPPTGFALAAVLLWGVRVWPAIFAGAFLANLTTAGTIATSLAIAAGNTLEALVGGYLILRWSNGRHTFDSPAGVARFALVSLAPGPLISATVGVGTLALAGLAQPQNFAGIWTTWWLGNVAGALLFAPALILWINSLDAGSIRKDFTDTLAAFAAGVAVGIVAFSPLIPPTPYRGALGFLAILPLMWAALRRNQRDTATVALILCGFAGWGTVAGSGPFVGDDMNQSFLLLLAFMISASIPSLALSADAAERFRTEHALRGNEARFRALAETAPAIIWTAAPDGAITFHNRQWLDFTGVPPEENVRHWARHVLHPDDLERCVTAWRHSLDSGNDYEIEVRNRRHDGEYRWFLTRATPVRDENGRIIEWFGSSVDIHALKESQNRQAILLAELNHRVKNMLAVVQSIASRSLTTDRSAEESKSILNSRLAALARAHDLLTHSVWAGAPISELMRVQTEGFSERIMANGPPVMLKPAAVQTFVLVMHELATNAVKYGALSDPAGRIAVRWWVEGAGEQARFHLTWEESDGPPVRPPERRGFGLTLLERLVSEEFNRAPDVLFEHSGFRFELDAPLEAIAADAPPRSGAAA